MRELTQEIKDLIKAQVEMDLHPSLLSNKEIVESICKQRETLWVNNEIEIEGVK